MVLGRYRPGRPRYDTTYMEPRGKHPFAALVLSVLMAAAVAGAAVAYPQQVRSAVIAAHEAVFGDDHAVKAHDAESGDPAAPEEHTVDECQAALDGVIADLPEEGDSTGLAHAIEVVEANCEKNPKARGLLNALEHLVANQAKHEAHDAEHGNSGEHGNGNANGHSKQG